MSTPAPSTGEFLPGVWRFAASHPEWEPGDGWEPEVAWWAVATEDGILLVDPLVDDWDALDGLVEAGGGCAGVVRLVHFHQRSVSDAAARYGADVLARTPPAGVPEHPLDRPLEHGREITPGVTPYWAPRDDELVLWLPVHRALVFGDVVLRGDEGGLRLCPASWLDRDGGPEPVRTQLRDLSELGPAHVLVAHGPLILGDGRDLARIAAGPA